MKKKIRAAHKSKKSNSKPQPAFTQDAETDTQQDYYNKSSEDVSSESSQEEYTEFNFKDSKIYNRISNTSIFKNSQEIYNNYYNSDRVYGKYLRGFSEKAYTITNNILKTVEPYQPKLAIPLKNVDEFGANCFDFVQSKVDTLKRDPNGLYSSSRSAIDNYRNIGFTTAMESPKKLLHTADNNLSALIDNILHYVDEDSEKEIDSSNFKTTQKLYILSEKLLVHTKHSYANFINSFVTKLHKLIETINNKLDSAYLSEFFTQTQNKIKETAARLNASLKQNSKMFVDTKNKIIESETYKNVLSRIQESTQKGNQLIESTFIYINDIYNVIHRKLHNVHYRAD